MITLIVVTLISVVAVIVVWRSVGGIVVIIVGAILRIKERAPIPVTDVETFWIVARETMHAVDDFLWKGEVNETLTVQSSAIREAHKEVCPLGIAGGLQGNEPGGFFLHGVVVGFVDMGVLAKLYTAVLRVVDGEAGDDLAWAEVPSKRR